MVILGIGTDIIKVDRIGKAVRRTENFLVKCFTEKEICYFKLRKFNPETIAGFFAAKEAVSKAIGTGFRGFGLRDVEVTINELGKPEVMVSKKVIDILKKESIKIHLSISHTEDDAIAFVVLEEA